MIFPQKILFLELWGLGDFVIATYSLPALRSCFANAKIAVLCSGDVSELMQGCPYADEIISYKFPWTKHGKKYSFSSYDWKSFISLLIDLRRRNYDIVIGGRPDPRNNFLSWLVGGRERVGFGSRGCGFFLTKSLSKHEENQHQLGRWEAALRAIGCVKKPRRHGFWLSTFELQEAERIMGESGISSADAKEHVLIGIHYGASKPQRRWPMECFAEVADLVSQSPNVIIVVFSDTKENWTVFPNSAVILLPKVGIRILCALITKIDILLCNDSGPMHIADAVRTPVVALFGRGVPSEFGPIGPEHIIIEAKVDCRPCYVGCSYSKPKCWDTIEVSEVVEALEMQIRKLRNRRGGSRPY
jgi:heptosyltransferase-2